VRYDTGGILAVHPGTAIPGSPPVRFRCSGFPARDLSGKSRVSRIFFTTEATEITEVSGWFAWQPRGGFFGVQRCGVL